MSEWIKEHDWKSCVPPKAVPRVRIPPPPPFKLMLIFLQIKNYIFIENLKLEFSSFNIFTGETGAGKSIIVESISLLCGEKLSNPVVGPYSEKCELIGAFDIKNIKEEIQEILSDTEIPLEDELLIRREIDKQNRSKFFINDILVSSNLVKLISDLIVDIHGQNQHQKLLTSSYQLSALDKFAGIEELVKNYKLNYNLLKKKQQQYENLKNQLQTKKQKMELLSYQINEIEQAKLTPEDEKLEEELQKAKNAQKVLNIISDIKFNLTEISQKLTNLEKLFSTLSSCTAENIDLASINEIHSNLENLETLLENYRRKYSTYTTEYIDSIIDRVDLIKKLKRKYGSTIEEIKNYYENAKKQLEDININEQQIETLQKEIEDLENILVDLGKKISKERIKAAKKFEELVNKEFTELGLQKAKLQIKIETALQDKNNLTSVGFDKVEFLVSTNPGSPFLPLKDVVSGGELSRIMLAIKTIFGQKENTPIMIFDEIDSGVGGPMGFIIGKKLKQLVLKNKQIFCITHLPQIASFAERHFFVKKQQAKDKTTISVEVLNQTRHIEEIARMLSGSKVDDISIKHAKNLIEEAKNIK